MVAELLEELREVLRGRPVLDGALPVVVFGVAAGWSVPWAAAAAVSLGVFLAIARRRRGGTGTWALGGIAGVALGAVVAVWSDSAGGFFVPGIVRGAGVAVVGMVSLLLPLPMVAWTSALFRRWPTGWYRHAAVRPAYVETTLLWVVFFGLRALAQWRVLDLAASVQTAVAVVLGWPGTIALLVTTYLYGTRRLRRLGGPSVAEFEAGTPPPWEGQGRGF